MAPQLSTLYVKHTALVFQLCVPDTVALLTSEKAAGLAPVYCCKRGV